MNEETRRAIVAEIAAAMRPATKREYQFDADDIMAQCPGMTRAKIYERLKRKWQAGEYKSELISRNGRQVRVFWRPGDVSQA